MAKRGGFPGGGMGNMGAMMKQAQKMQAELAKAQEEVKTMSFEATAGGGMVKVTALGDNTIQSIAIDPEAVDPEDVEMLEDMVLAAVNEALRGVSDMAAARMSAATGGGRDGQADRRHEHPRLDVGAFRELRTCDSKASR